MPITGNGNGIDNVQFNGTVVEEVFFNGTSVYTNARYITVTGGTETTTDANGVVDASGDYKTHTFTGSGMFTVTALGNAAGSNDLSIILVGAGGGGRGGGRWFLNGEGSVQFDGSNQNGGRGDDSTLILSGSTLATGDGGNGGNVSGNRRIQSGGAPTNNQPGLTNGDDFSGGGFTGTGGAYVSNSGLSNNPVSHVSGSNAGGIGTGVGAGGGGGLQYNANAATDGGLANSYWQEGGDAGSLSTTTISPANVNSVYTVTIGSGGSGGQNLSTLNGDNSVYGTRRGGKGAPGAVSITYQFQN